MKKAADRISLQVRIPGFRPGKAPRPILERHVGKGAILEAALDALLPDVYAEAVAAEEVAAIDSPEIELTSAEPLVFRATVPVAPEVELNNYQEIRIPVPEISVSDEERENGLLELRRQHAVLEPVDRGITWGDTVRVDVSVQLEGEDEPHVESDAEFSLQEGVIISLPGFAEELIGLERGGPYDFTITLDQDFAVEALRDKTASYSTTVKDVKQELLPELDEEFLQAVGDGFDDLDQLNEHIVAELVQAKEAAQRDEYRAEVVDTAVALATLDYPQLLVEREIDRMIDIQSNHASHTEEGLNQWLSATGQTLGEVREQLEANADAGVRRMLVFGHLATVEEIEVSDELVEEELDRVVASTAGPEAPPEQRDVFRSMIDTEHGRASIRDTLLSRLVLERLEEIASQPELVEAPRAERGRRRGRRRSGSGDGDGSPQTDTPEGEMPEDEMPEDEMPEDEMPEDEMPEDEMPEDEMPEDEMPEDEMPEDEMPEDEMPEGEMPEDEMPEDEMPEDEMPEDEMPEDEMPEDEMPEDEMPEDEMPEDEMPEDEMPEDEA